MLLRAFPRRTLLGALAAAPVAAALPPAEAQAPASIESEPTTLDPDALARAADRAAGLDQLHSLIVARGGTIALAEAFRGPALDRPVNVKSVSKTIVAALAGAALDRGILAGVDQPMADLLAGRIPAGADPRVNDITIADLLTMQAGLERTSGAHYGRWVESPNWVAHALSRPFVADPGAGMQYSTGSFHLLGVALAEAAGRSLLDLAREWLGAPLGIEIPAWTRDPQGFYMGGNEMALAPLALYRFGEMARNAGRWDGDQVLSADWMARSWTPRTRSPFSGDQYGYGWFLTRIADRPTAYARGYGGQMLFVVPSLALTVAVTSDPTRPARSGGYVGDLRALLAEEIIPAALVG